MTTKETTILNFLNKCNIPILDISSLNGTNDSQKYFIE